MNNKIDRDKIKQEVVRKFNIIITDNDPIWNLVALNSAVIDQYLEMVLSNLDTFQLNLNAVHERHLKQIKADAATYVGQVITEALRVAGQADGENRKVFAGEVDKQRKLLVAAMEGQIGMMQKWMWVSLGAAGFSVVGLFLMFLLIKFF